MEDCLLVEEAKQKGYRFKVIDDPTYAYSLRRLRAKGVFKTAFSSLQMHIRRFLSNDFSNTDFGYSMTGGEQYDQVSCAND